MVELSISPAIRAHRRPERAGSVPCTALSAACARGWLVGWRGFGQERRLLDDSAAQHARLPVGRIVKHAGLPRRYAVLPGDQINLDALRATAEPGRPRRSGRAHPHEHLVPANTKRLLDRALADPVDVAQPHAARPQRLARADDDAPRRRIEPHHIERIASRDAKPAALSDREAN